MLEKLEFDSNQEVSKVQSITRIVLRPYANSLPLGCFAFGVGNVLISAYALHWMAASDKTILAVILLAFVAPLELIPCIMAFLSRDTGGATAMGVFAAAWVVLGIQHLISPPGSISVAIGIFVLMLAMILTMLAIGTFPGKPLLGTLLCVAIVRSLAAAGVEFNLGSRAVHFAAWSGLLLAAFAFYSGLGFLLEDIKQKPLAMTFRRSDAKDALTASLTHQIEPLTHEAGVRQQL